MKLNFFLGNFLETIVQDVLDGGAFNNSVLVEFIIKTNGNTLVQAAKPALLWVMEQRLLVTMVF